jgi:hypothetical protein
VVCDKVKEYFSGDALIISAEVQNINVKRMFTWNPMSLCNLNGWKF